MEIETTKKSSWLAMNAKVKQARILIHQYGTKVPANFSIGTQNQSSMNWHKNGVNGEVTRPPDDQLFLLFVCAIEPGSESTLFTVNLPSNLEDDKEFHGQLHSNKLIDSTGKPLVPRILNIWECLNDFTFYIV